MQPSHTSATLDLDRTHLVAFTRRATGRPDLQLADWHAALVHGGATTNARVYRVVGQGIDQGQIVAWSLVLKEWRKRDTSDALAARGYWMREACAYQSSMLTTPRAGLRPAACFGVCAQGDAAIWLALEDVQAAQPRPWGLDDYAQAAEHLGQFNGSFLQQPLPTERWLSRDWLRSWVAICEAAVLDLPQMLRYPLVRAHISDALAQEVRRLWSDRHELLDALDQLPHTICHRDAFVRNLFVDRAADGERRTIAIDWATIGIGPIGEDVATLVGGSLVFFELDSADLPRVAAPVLQRYIAGLRSRGWGGDPQQPRLGYAATLALRYGLGSALDIAIVADDSSHAWAEQVLGRPIADLAANTARNLAFFLTCAEEARGLCRGRR